MSDSSPLTPAQRRFLRALELDCDPTAPSARILGRLPLARMAQWLEQPAFRQRIEQLLEMVAKKRRMTLQMASGRAAERLDASFDSIPGDAAALNTEQRRTCVELVKLVEGRRGHGAGNTATADSPTAGSAMAGQVRQTRTADSAKSGTAREISSPASLAHPDVSPEEARELKERLDTSALDEATNAP